MKHAVVVFFSMPTMSVEILWDLMYYIDNVFGSFILNTISLSYYLMDYVHSLG